MFQGWEGEEPEEKKWLWKLHSTSIETVFLWLFTTSRNVVTELGVMRSCDGVSGLLFFLSRSFLWISRCVCVCASAAGSGQVWRPVTCVLGVLGGWNFLCKFTPSWGADNQNFREKFDEKNCRISPTHYPAHNSCSKGPRGLKFVMRIDPPHAGPTTTFLFLNSTNIVHFFILKKNIKKILLIPLTAQP